MATSEAKETLTPLSRWTSIKHTLAYFAIYITGVVAFLSIIFDPLTTGTYFSDNSLLPGLVNREFSLVTEAEYYIKILEKLSGTSDKTQPLSLANLPAVTNYLKNELDNFGLETYEQSFSYTNADRQQFNGTNLYSIIRCERCTNSEAIALAAPFRKDSSSNTISSVALSLTLAKYFSSKSYWAKDVIILFVDREENGLTSWLDSYYDVDFRSDMRKANANGLYYDSLAERSGPLQAAIVLELNGLRFTHVNVKIQGMYGQLPNLDLFNLVVELAARESVTPYFHGKSLPFGIPNDRELYKHHLETAFSFMKTQATMQADGLHGLFLRYSIQSLTIEGPQTDKNLRRNTILTPLLNIGRLVEGVFRSLNNLTERFNRSYYFYIIVSLRRFTSIGYYMAAFGVTIAPVLLKAYVIHKRRSAAKQFIGLRAVILLASALILSLLSTFNISAAMFSASAIVPVLLIL